MTEVPVVSCAAPHDYEIYFSFNATGSTYPGEDANTRSCCARQDRGHPQRRQTLDGPGVIPFIRFIPHFW